MKKYINRLYSLIEYVVVFILLLFICFTVNKGIVIKGLFMDDLFHWSWFRYVPNFYEFALKFYDTATRYRPVFDSIQYLIYSIVGTDPLRFVIVNMVYNSLVALFIYHFTRKFSAGMYISFLLASLYLVGHYAYYQIGQAIGSLETNGIIFSLLTLYYAVKLVEGFPSQKIGDVRTKKEIKLNIFLMYFFFFIVSFAHERYLGVIVTIILSILFMGEYVNHGEKVSKKENLLFKIKCLFLLVLELICITIIRFKGTGNLIPAGTGGTRVEQTFNVFECFNNCFRQVATIFGINIGPEHLYGIDFENISNASIKYLTIASICFILVIFLVYLLKKLKNKDFNFKNDLLILSYIAICIGSSSVTVRVELRFVYSGYTGALIYLGYILGYLSHPDAFLGTKNPVDYKVLKKINIIPMLLITLVFLTRLPVELEYRNNFNKIYCYVDQARMNSLYDLTIGKYGTDEILHNKKIYVQNNYFGMTKFYAEYFFKIYDEKDIGNEIILFNDISEVDLKNDNIIVLAEDLVNNVYMEVELPKR